MLTRLALIFSVIAVDLALNGCTRCGPTRRFDAIAEALRRSPASRTVFGAQAATLGVEAGAVVYRWENAGSVP
jgi:hypothetical protein